MKITNIQSQVIRLPAVEALADGPVAHGASRDIVILTLGTDAGIEGIGLTTFDLLVLLLLPPVVMPQSYLDYLLP